MVVDLEREIIACLRNAVQFFEFGHKFGEEKTGSDVEVRILRGCLLVL